MQNNNLNIIKKETKEFFEKASFAVDISVSAIEENTILVKIKTEDPKILIGQNGQVLAEVQKLLKLILKKRVPDDFYLDLDVNDYKKKKLEYLKETAKDLANEVSLTGTEKAFPAMPSYERRVVHMELSSRTDVVTESVGLDPDRKIIIKPAIKLN